MGDVVVILIGFTLVTGGLLMDNRAPSLVMRAVHLWPRRMGTQDIELMYSSLFLLRFVGLWTTVTGLVVLLAPFA